MSYDEQPIFEFEYGTIDHTTDHITSIFWADDFYDVGGTALRAISEAVTTNDTGLDEGRVTWEKRAFLVPTGLPEMADDAEHHGFLDVDSDFTVSLEQGFWYLRGAWGSWAGDDQWRKFDPTMYEEQFWEPYEERLEQQYPLFVGWYFNDYGYQPCMTFRTLIQYRAKWDKDDDYGFDDAVVGAETTMDTDHELDNHYEVLYNADIAALKYSGQVMVRTLEGTDEKETVNARSGDGYATMPSQPAMSTGADDTWTYLEEDPDAAFTDASNDAWRVGFYFSNSNVIESLRDHFETDERSLSKSTEYLGARTVQLAHLVGVDIIPRAYATKRQLCVPLKFQNLSSMASETATTSTRSTPMISTATTTSTGGSY